MVAFTFKSGVILRMPMWQAPVGTGSAAGVLTVGFRGTAGKTAMLGRHVYRVHPTEQSWTVTKEGEDQPRVGFADREAAIAAAVRVAEADEPAKVTVDNGDGTIAEEWLFGSDLVTKLGA